MTSPAAIAAEEFCRRRETALRKVAAGEIDLRQGAALLQPWLALACRAGADLPDFADALRSWRQPLPGGRMGETLQFTEQEARALCAEDICPREQAVETLAAARDAALYRHDTAPTPERARRARDLVALACAFHARPFQPRPRLAQPERTAA